MRSVPHVRSVRNVVSVATVVLVVIVVSVRSVAESRETNYSYLYIIRKGCIPQRCSLFYSYIYR